ncbi:MAG: hypothetical protein KA144_12480 [Xanthomonadaceae bacterium]|nr:hypothetical protein [Xanthomonadaceae bacterium]
MSACSEAPIIAACNATIMRLKRGDGGDRAAALALLERGIALGDAKSRTRLNAGRTRR